MLQNLNGYQSIHMTTLKGKPKICPECKGNGYLKTGMNTIVQCLNCWSEGEIDETIWARNYDPIIPDELQSIEKD
jgi:DNA polymerase IIIc chi subunit